MTRSDDLPRPLALADSALRELPGGDALLAWFGRVPSFHDAELLEIVLASNGASMLRLYAWALTEAVDAQGHVVLDKHAVVTITLHQVTAVALTDFGLPGIIGALDITKAADGYTLAWDSAYGVSGSLSAKQAGITLSPGRLPEKHGGR